VVFIPFWVSKRVGGNKKMAKYKCTACDYVYDEDKGDPDNGVSAGTKWEDVPEDWVCPECGVGKDMFEKAEEE
jgi:rubredoxin